MGFSETIRKIKELSNKLRCKNIADREVIHFMSELHRHIDNLEVPQLIGEIDDNVSGNILHN